MELPGRGVASGTGAPGLRISRVLAAALAVWALCAAVAALRPTPADSSGRRALPPGFFGVAATSPTARDARLIQRSGIRTVRFGIPWPVIEPADGTFVWAPLDQEIARLARQHVGLLPFVIGTPDWTYTGTPTTPTARRAFAAFVSRVVDRYGPQGSFWETNPSLPRRPIRELQVWNEPNFPSYWGGRVSATGYAKLLQASAKAVRAASSQVKVVLAGLGPGLAKSNQVPSWKFLEQLYRKGAKRYFDVAADHPYGANVAAMADQLRHVASVMRRHHDHAPLYITELGWSSGHRSGSHLEVGSVRRQAAVLRRAVRVIVHHARRFHIKRMFWYDWRDPPASAPINRDGAFDFGLRRNDYAPKPAWRAYVRWTKG